LVVEQVHQHFASAQVRDFVPLLVERRAHRELSETLTRQRIQR
jgi:hypothetical protein